MLEMVAAPEHSAVVPDIRHIITEDDEPVDNLPSDKQQRLLVEPVYTSAPLKGPFLVAANVGIFSAVGRPPIVPDVFLSLEVEVAEDWWAQEHRSYFLWEFGKPPDVVIEIVSNRVGGETGKKLQDYAQLGVPYYVIYDPQHLVQSRELLVYELHVGEYLPRPDYRLEKIGLALTFWEGAFEKKHARWLRWCDLEGRILLTGAEQAEQERQRAEQERQRAEQEHQRAEQEQQRAEQGQKQAEQERQRAEQEQQRAEQERQRAEQERERAERLAAQLRLLGVEPDA